MLKNRIETASRVMFAVLLTLSLIGCLGGGGGGDTTPPITTANPAGGVFNDTQQVSLTANETATIYYSTDGNDPSVGGLNTTSGNSPISGIPISAVTTILKFFAIDSAGNQETVKTENYGVVSESGTWIGSYSTNLLAETPLSLELVQIGATVEGTYTDKAGGFGIFGATVSGTNFDMTITSSDPDCPGSFTGIGSIVGASLEFTFIGTTCLGVHNNGVGSVTYQVGTVLEYGLQSPSNLLLSGADLLWTDLSEEPIKKMPVTGGTPLALTRYLGVPVSMTIQGNDMYWIEYRPEGAASCTPGLSQVLNKSSLDGSVTEQLATGERCAHEKANLVIDNNNAYWITSTVSPNEYSIQKVPLDGSAPTIITSSLLPIDTMVRDTDYLYWVEGRFPDPGVIKRIPLAGGAITEIYTVTNGITGDLIVEGPDLFVAEIVYPYPENYRLLKIPVGGGSPTVLATLAQDPYRIKITSNATTIYWSDRLGVFSMPISGGSITQFASLTYPAYDIAVDATSVIWIEEGDAGTGSIISAPLSGGIPSVLATNLFMFNGYKGVLAVSANKIYVTEGDYYLTWHGRIAEIPRLGGEVTSFITGITAGNNPMVISDADVFVVDGGFILKLPIGGEHVERFYSESLAMLTTNIDYLATDGIYVYWIEKTSDNIMRVPVDGGLIWPLTTSLGFREKIITDGVYVYWIEGLNKINRVSISGFSGMTVATAGIVSDIITDGTYIYFTDVSANAIQRVSIDGGPVTDLAALHGSTVWATLAQDNTHVYSISDIDMRKVPKAGGTTTVLIEGGFIVDIFNPSSIAVDSSNVYWTEFDGGTIKSHPK